MTETVEPALPLTAQLEAVLLVAEEPIPVMTLAERLEVPVPEIEQTLRGLVEEYAQAGRGFELREVGGGWRYYTAAAAAEYVERFVLAGQTARLSQAALETLAVIAYKQPISRGAIASIRAVNVDSVVRTLAGRGLITELFTDSETGAINYGTTDLLLTQLGINSIEELPKISPLLSDGAEGFDDVR